MDLNKIRCDGCRSDRSRRHWSPDCKILDCCVYQREIEFCAECPEFPCSVLENWGREYEHHAKAVKRLQRMKKVGVLQWLTEQGMNE